MPSREYSYQDLQTYEKSSHTSIPKKNKVPEESQIDQAKRSEKLWELMGEYIGHDKTSIQKQIVSHIEYTLAKSRFDFNIQHCC